MDKILVEIVLPSANKCYDMYIPLASQISDVLYLSSKLLEELSSGYFKSSEDSVLCEAETGKVLDINNTVYEAGLKNGSKLLLI